MVFIFHVRVSTIVHSDSLYNKIQSFPYQLDGWQGKDLVITQAVVSDLKTSNLLVRRYIQKKFNASADVYLVYSAGSSVFHPPEYCYIGLGEAELLRRSRGWIVADRGDVPYTMLEFRSKIKGEKFFVAYWFLSRSQATANYYMQRFLNFAGNLGFFENEWLLIRVTLVPGRPDLSDFHSFFDPFLQEIHRAGREILRP